MDCTNAGQQDKGNTHKPPNGQAQKHRNERAVVKVLDRDAKRRQKSQFSNSLFDMNKASKSIGTVVIRKRRMVLASAYHD
jgi:hypothetical protein